MDAKAFEIRDKGTFIPCVGIRMKLGGTKSRAELAAQRYLLHRAGYSLFVPSFSKPLVLFGRMHSGIFHHDCNQWRDRTMRVAHKYIEENWDSLPIGAVVDVRFVLGETSEPEKPKRLRA